jgi:hypothetical protein
MNELMIEFILDIKILCFTSLITIALIMHLFIKSLNAQIDKSTNKLERVLYEIKKDI